MGGQTSLGSKASIALRRWLLFVDRVSLSLSYLSYYSLARSVKLRSRELVVCVDVCTFPMVLIVTCTADG